MTANSQPAEAALSPLKQLLADLDASRAAKADDETLSAIEARLARATPIEEDDVFTLMARLADKNLSSVTLARITENIGKVAPFISARYRRLSIWTQLRESAVASFRGQQSEAQTCLSKAAGLVSVVQMVLEKSGDAKAGDAVVLSLTKILGDALNEMTAATTLLQSATGKFDENLPLLKQFVEQSQTEERLFTEAMASSMQ